MPGAEIDTLIRKRYVKEIVTSVKLRIIGGFHIGEKCSTDWICGFHVGESVAQSGLVVSMWGKV